MDDIPVLYLSKPLDKWILVPSDTWKKIDYLDFLFGHTIFSSRNSITIITIVPFKTTGYWYLLIFEMSVTIGFSSGTHYF